MLAESWLWPRLRAWGRFHDSVRDVLVHTNRERLASSGWTGPRSASWGSREDLGLELASGQSGPPDPDWS